MKYKFLIILFILLGINCFVGAVPPFQSTTVAEFGLEIEATNSLYLKQNTTHTFHFRVYNASDGVYISPDIVTCSFGIANDTGDFIIIINDVANGTNYRFDVEVLGGNFTWNEVYHKGINCLLDDGTAGGVLTQSFEITTTGHMTPEDITTFLGILLFIIFGLACFMMFLSITMGEGALKIFFLIVSLIFLMATLITGYMVLIESNVITAISTTTLSLIIVMGVILIIIFAWILIRQTINTLDLFKINKGLGMSNNVGVGRSVGGYDTRKAY